MNIAEAKPTYQRGAVNTIYKGRVYQRGQIMTWDLDKKRQLFIELNIGMVVNFWSKLDADMSECGVVYIYKPTPHSIDMLDKKNLLLADYISSFVSTSKTAALILCEAGKTRSVYFSALVLSSLKGITHRQALEEIKIKVPSHRLKQFMIDDLNGR